MQRVILVLAVLVSACASPPESPAPPAATVVVNDAHSRLNETAVAEKRTPASVAEIQEIVRDAARRNLAVSIAGGRHAMGGQQFGAGTLLIDMQCLSRILRFDAEHGTIDVEAGIQWPELLSYLTTTQARRAHPWGFRQKQTGADRLSIGGALAANIHGRGLAFPPFVSDVVHFTLVDPNGNLVHCSREKNAELFGLAIGGYGLFGVIVDVRLRLYPRTKLERVVTVAGIDEIADLFTARIRDGYLYGDFQFSIDNASENFLRRGVFSTYRPAAAAAVMPAVQNELAEADWRELYCLAHTDKAKLYDRYVAYYQSTNGQLYWSDAHQMSTYIDNYHEEVDRHTGATTPGSEIITEIYVPLASLKSFCAQVRIDFLASGANLIYGTVRLIRRDTESFLAWASDDFACVIFNLHVDHDERGIEKAKRAFRILIDRGLEYEGSYYLTYHRWARKDQIERAYPQFVDFLRFKREYDPAERFQSDWYRHYRDMFADDLEEDAAAPAEAPEIRP